VPTGGGNLTFWTSYDTEPAWDDLFVEPRTAGGSDWTTLRDANGHTTTAPGDSCAAGWRDLHPWLDPLPDVQPRRRNMHGDRKQRRLERGLRRLGAVAGRPV
jgi:hypothetical protein